MLWVFQHHYCQFFSNIWIFYLVQYFVIATFNILLRNKHCYGSNNFMFSSHEMTFTKHSKWLMYKWNYFVYKRVTFSGSQFQSWGPGLSYLTHLIEILSSLVQFMALSPNKLMISIRCVNKGDMQNMPSRGSPGLELRTLTHITWLLSFEFDWIVNVRL